MPIDIARRQERYRRFYADPRPGRMLILSGYAGGSEMQPIVFSEFDFTQEREHYRYWDRLIENLLCDLADRADLDDDWMPGIEPYYGFGSFGAVYCDAPLTFTDTTCYIDKALDRLEDMDTLDMTRERFWARMFMTAAQYLSMCAQGRFLVSAYPNPSPLDVANLLRGNDIFTDIYEQPDLFKRFLVRCRDAAIANWQRIDRLTHNTGGGALAFGRWIPRGILLLEDAADLISPQLYREFGQPYTQTMIDAAGGAYLHHHSLGKQQYANMAGLRGLQVEQISSDPGCRRPVTEVEAIYARVGGDATRAGVAIDLECTPDEVYEHIEALKKGKVILSVQAGSKAEAQRLVRFVRSHSEV